MLALALNLARFRGAANYVRTVTEHASHIYAHTKK